MLVGREREQRELAELVTRAVNGRSGALVLRGAAGIGKSALLADLARQAASRVDVLRASGVETEVNLPFAALHQLLRPLLGRLDRLPGPQAAALRATFGLESAPADRFLVALAVLSLLADAAEDRPLLVLVDDAHWLDGASADALLFLARRLDADGIALVLAARDDDARPFPAPGLPELRLGPLTTAAAQRLLAQTMPGTAAAARERLLHEAAGNPLALLELPTALTAEQLQGSAPLPEHLPLSERLHRLFLHRATRLPARTRWMLLLAAAEDGGDLATVLAAGGSSAGGMEALSPAVDVGLISVDGRELRFRHPLVRSALYQAASFPERQSAHLALAAALGEGDDRRVWHRAAAVVGSDDGVAQELAEVAGRARRTGGVAVATSALERAAALASSPRARACWLIQAAECAWSAAEAGRASMLLDRAESMTTEPELRGRAARVRGAITHASSSPATACRVLLEGARLVLRADAMLAGEMLVMAARAAWVGNDPATLTEIAGLVGQIDPEGVGPAGELRQHLGWLGQPRATEGGAPPEGKGAPHAGLLAWLRGTDPKPWVWPPTFLPHLVDDAETALDGHERAVVLLRTRGEAGALPMAVAPLAALQLTTGRWTSAIANATEALALADDTGQLAVACQLRAQLAWLAAARGDFARCRELADAALRGAVPRRIACAVATTHWALGMCALGEGEPARAAALLREVLAPGQPAEHFMVSWLVLPDLVEAWSRAGDHAKARAALQQFEDRVADLDLPRQRGLLRRSAALVATGATAERLFRQALEEPPPSPFEVGRTHLLFGEWLRRSRRVKAGREHLHTALTHFRLLGATPWAERATAELRAAGHRGAEPVDTTATVSQLTPRELQIVRFAAQGMTNQQIAAQLFLSPRTVGYHLYKVFPKLGVTSRGQLRDLDLDRPES
ncbi:regulatory protein, luxR family [Streptoalloteichus tenebrarius]|uniref:Regulatory protein, luxR family n=1 Tax=Streptoalloteichus tenebrarius (strain ATCC 17920 / DSM 40477 / JCM 4838 / CBS 697.72 / NBRC 16177 / NCIMB 11028 / NRRL B-12390 / A12253. 1 / ISP 5477) TaxID=1933 RepID=A0ABT1HQG4_STRSD|nr:LuxR family transcriptional regulator [Streptoalloteichus tenebrarius]MCP2257756.1 regulatory protein, luxR family [Streptoalloteichus tenebrarius]BFE99885.1 LuxR family transcriptional regulator [Streptoalloteichus tenebrarius]